MAKTSRNAPCPCGSGKKYKQCCLRRERDGDRQAHLERDAPEIALTWLLERYRDQMLDSLDEGFFALDDNARGRLERLPDEYDTMVLVNSHEWLLAEGVIKIRRRHLALMDLVLGPGGPLLDACQRTYLEKLRSRPMGLYEVLESEHGRGIWLRDLLDPDARRQWIEERTGSRSLRKWTVIGARLIPGDPWKLSGAIYAIPRERYLPLLETLRDELAAHRDDPAMARSILSAAIIGTWLDALLAPPPEMVDASSGESLVLVNDHYRVNDWNRLAAVLESQDDVEGNREEGWTRFWTLEGGMRRSRLALNPRSKNRLVAFARTLKMADEGRVWLEGLAGAVLSHVTREIEDPAHLWEERFRPPRRSEDADLPSEARQEIYEHLYRDWAETPVPALDGKSPRRAIATEEGLEKVVELLKLYEVEELRQAEDEEREPVDFEFLWRDLRLDRERILGRWPP